MQLPILRRWQTLRCGSGALAAITGRTHGVTWLIAARAPLPQVMQYLRRSNGARHDNWLAWHDPQPIAAGVPLLPVIPVKDYPPLLKPTVEWEPSQNGLFCDAPQRHK